MLLEPRDSPPKQQYSKRMCRSTWPAQSQGATALLNAKQKKIQPLTLLFSLKKPTRPTPYPSFLAGFLLQQWGDSCLPQLSQLPHLFFLPRGPSFSASHEREPWALCPGRCVVLWVFYVTCFSGHSSHKKLDLSGSGAV